MVEDVGTCASDAEHEAAIGRDAYGGRGASHGDEVIFASVAVVAAVPHPPFRRVIGISIGIEADGGAVIDRHIAPSATEADENAAPDGGERATVHIVGGFRVISDIQVAVVGIPVADDIGVGRHDIGFDGIGTDNVAGEVSVGVGQFENPFLENKAPKG